VRNDCASLERINVCQLAQQFQSPEPIAWTLSRSRLMLKGINDEFPYLKGVLRIPQPIYARLLINPCAHFWIGCNPASRAANRAATTAHVIRLQISLSVSSSRCYRLHELFLLGC
jgi:hypothetical protein